MVQIIRPRETVLAPQQGLQPISNAGARAAAAGAAIGQQQIGLAMQVASIGEQAVAMSTAYFKEVNKSTSDSQYNNALTEATLEFNRSVQGRMEVTSDKDGNPTFGTLAKDIGDIGNDIIQRSASKISNPKARQRFINSFSRHIGNRQILGLKEARRQHIDYARAALQNGLKTQVEQSLADEDANINNYQRNVEEMIDNAVQGGVISAQEGVRYKDATISDIRVTRFDRMIEEDPESAVKVLDGSPQSLGLKTSELITLRKRADAAVFYKQRAESRAARELQELEKKRQRLVATDLDLSIIQGTATAQAIMKAADKGEISGGQRNTLLKALNRKNKSTENKIKIRRAIDADLEKGQPLIDYTPKQIGDHYKEQVAALTAPADETSGTPAIPPTLSQKAGVASQYTAPVKPFTKELEFGLLHGNSQQALEALRAFELIDEKSPVVVSGLKSKARAVASATLSLTENTTMSPAQALRQARQSVLEVDDVEIKQRDKDFKNIDKFKVENLEETINDMFGTEGFFGKNKKIAPGVKGRIHEIYRESYKLTGDEAAAIALTKSQTSALYGVSKFNGDNTIMFVPPEKAYPGVPIGELRQDLEGSVAGFLPEGVNAADVKIESDSLTRASTGQITYGLSIEKDVDGQKIRVPLLDPNTGSPLRWSPDIRELQNKREEAEITRREEIIEKAEQSRERTIEAQEEIKDIDEQARKGLRLRGESSMGDINMNKIPPRRQAAVQVIQDAGDKVGVDPTTLAAISKVESAWRPNAKARTSSASGLFQFIRGTWADMVRKHGKKHGIGMGDVFDPRANAIMGAEFTKENINFLQRKLGREPTLREVYLAHFSGAGKALRVIQALERDPNAPVGSVYSAREIRANRGILKGTLRQSYLRLTNKVVRAAEKV